MGLVILAHTDDVLTALVELQRVYGCPETYSAQIIRAICPGFLVGQWQVDFLLVELKQHSSLLSKMLNIFFWNKEVHWVTAEILSLPVEERVAAIIREPLLRNPHVHLRGFECLVEGKAVATGVTRVG
eukprot:g33313.t1